MLLQKRKSQESPWEAISIKGSYSDAFIDSQLAKFNDLAGYEKYRRMPADKKEQE